MAPQSSSSALLLFILCTSSLLSSLKVTKTQNHVINSKKAHVKTTLFFNPSPHPPALYAAFDAVSEEYKGEEEEKA
jgi:hypothetical protein